MKLKKLKISLSLISTLSTFGFILSACKNPQADNMNYINELKNQLKELLDSETKELAKYNKSKYEEIRQALSQVYDKAKEASHRNDYYVLYGAKQELESAIKLAKTQKEKLDKNNDSSNQSNNDNEVIGNDNEQNNSESDLNDSTDQNDNSNHSELNNNGSNQNNNEVDNSNNDSDTTVGIIKPETDSTNSNNIESDSTDNNQNQPNNHIETKPGPNDQTLTNEEINNYYATHPELKRFSLANQTKTYSKNSDYLQSNFNRSISLIWNFDDGSVTAGTLWLLDYHKQSNAKYKLFFATNYHVALELFGTNDYSFNAQPNRTKKVKDVFIGVADDWRNKHSKFKYKKLRKEQFPKTLFLGHNFMDDKVASLFNNKRYYTEFSVIEFDYDAEKFANPYITAKEYAALSRSEQKVVSQAAKREKEDNKLIKQHLDKAITELDISINKFKDGSHNMQLNSLPYATMDYGSVNLYINNYLTRSNDDNKVFNQPNTINKIIKNDADIKKFFADTKLNAKPLTDYFIGFPYEINKPNPSLVHYNVSSNLLSSNDKIIDNLSNNVFVTQDVNNGYAIASHGAIFNNEPKGLFYGLTYSMLSDNSIIGGMSGSLVTNEDNLPIGLLFASDGKIPFLGDDNTYKNVNNALMVGFSLNVPFWSSKINNYVEPYNIIDGTNKARYPHQTNSYRQTLYKVYGNDYKTALFK
ncbi:DUF31 family protein [Mycoplasma sp. T363T]|uniref:MIP family Ig-specific serine endopeptidase n=1 Tax=Mycoplasma bradburyae TaxID=2963128 RepID=UPI002340D10B|nr:hypothetical protein [Mycoplasma bradburyae]MDC4163385.1 DUF31 family protein [Mycoplasma bradburyae]